MKPRKSPMLHFEKSITNQNDKRERLYLLIFVSWLILTIVAFKIPQGVYSDPAYGFKALMQNILEYSPSINHRMSPLDSDISRLKADWIYWWPAGSQLIVYPLVRNGVPLGAAVRIVTLAFILIGAMGWMRWVFMFRLPFFWNLIFAFFLPWNHYATDSISRYSTEICIFAISPWILCGAMQFGQALDQGKKISHGISAGLGVFMSSLFLFKYTGIFIAFGAMTYLGIKVYRGYFQKGYKKGVIHAYLILVISFAALPLAQNLLNFTLAGQPNPISATLKFGVKWEDILFLLSYPSMSPIDANSLWSYILLHPTHGLAKYFFGTDLMIESGSLWLAFLGLPGGLFILWLIVKTKVFDAAGELAKVSFLTGLAVIFFLFIISRAELYQARYFFSFTMAILPWCIQQCYGFKPNGFSLWKIFQMLALFYVILPFFYGFVAVIGKTMRVPSYVYGASGFYNPLLSKENIPRAQNSLLKDASVEQDVWYVTDPITALDVRGKVIIRHADFVAAEALRQKFVSSKPLSVHVIMPARFEQNGKGQIIRECFVQAMSWKKIPIEDGEYIRWDARLVV